MTLEKYDRQPQSLRSGIGISIHSFGSMTLGHALFKMLGQPRDVELWFDRDEQKLGITAAPQRTAVSFRVSKNRVITCKGFLRNSHIEHEVSRKYLATFREGMVLIDLHSLSARTFRGTEKQRPHSLPKIEPFTIVPKAS